LLDTLQEKNMRIVRNMLVWSMVVASVVLNCARVQAGSDFRVVPNDAQAVQPILAGQTFPQSALKGVDGSAVDVSALLAEKPSVVVFYRGGW
jgi:hypothetical protein